jgi:hypothetical protein
MASLRERVARALFGDVIEKAINAAVTVRVDDSAGWEPMSGGGPADRPWTELLDDLQDALEAWRKNFMIRRIVSLTRSYVVGNGITISSRHREVQSFLDAFWSHRKNRMDRRLGPMCDELTRSGELFVTLHTNPVDGISYVRFVPATQIREVDTDPNDYEKELRYGQIQQATTELRWWLSPEHPEALTPAAGNGLPPLMLHFAVNRPIGATRGESDLATILKWALRYSTWLEDRVRLNRIRTRAALLDIEIADDSQVEKKKYQLRRDDPLKAGIYVHGPGETATLHALRIDADDAEADGKALRLAIAAGSSTALHYMGEGEGTNYATAREMGEPTARFYTERQTEFINFLYDLVTTAHQRYIAVTSKRAPAAGDLQLQPSVTEIARADNQTLASAARDIVDALAEMRQHGWIDDQTAIRLAFKFAGEAIDEEEIKRILETGPYAPETSNDPTPEEENEGEP